MADVTLKLVVGFDDKAALPGLRGLQAGTKDAGTARQREFNRFNRAGRVSPARSSRATPTSSSR